MRNDAQRIAAAMAAAAGIQEFTDEQTLFDR
jgi:hypothetical protein